MVDAKIRGLLLAHFHSLRHANGGWVPISDAILAPEPVHLRVIGGVCQQLADIGLIQWKQPQDPSRAVAGMAKITGSGVAVFESGRCANIDVQFSTSDDVLPSRLNAATVELEKSRVLQAVEASAQPEPQQTQMTQRPDQTAPTPPVSGKQPEIFRFIPAFMGFSVDLKALWQCFAPRIQGWWKARS